MSDKLGLSFGSLQQVRSFDAKALSEHVKNGKAALLGKASDARTFVPQEIREFYDRTFERTEAEVLPLIEDIANRLQQLKKQGVTPQWRSGKVVVDDKERQRLANNFGTYEFTPDQVEYANKIEHLADVLNDIRAFEEAHNWNKWTAGKGGNYKAVKNIASVLHQQDDTFALLPKLFFNLLIQGAICFDYDKAKQLQQEASDDEDE